MTLKEYLGLHQITYVAFGEKIGASHEAVRRYAVKGRIPAPGMMRAIVAATDGAVQPNDFFANAGEAA